jgi:hypothetical protein
MSPSKKRRRHLRFPSIDAVARALRDVSANVECDPPVDGEPSGCDVRLQVYPEGVWWIRYGLSDYDQDHRGYWGASSVPGVVNGVVQRFRSREVARDLIEQARESYAWDDEGVQS